MARMIELECPSGLRVKLRSIKGKDLDVMRDNRRLATGEGITSLLDSCTVEVLDKSIYQGEQFSWVSALVGDRMRAVLGLRAATTGDEYEFRVRCSDQNCRQMIDWSLSLNDLPIKPLPEASKTTFVESNRFTANVLGQNVVFKLLTGRDQLQIVKREQQRQQQRKGPASNEHARTLMGLTYRIVEVEGVDDVLDWLEDLDLRDLKQVVSAMDQADCGVDTSIEIECTGPNGCGLRQAVELPLDGRFFTIAL